jgi:DNA-binding transcriptional ArsR family regulator
LTTLGGRSTFNHVVEQTRQLDEVFHALADPTRRAMLRSLARGEASIGDLAAPYRMSLAAASKHVKVLERAGLLQRTVQGRTHLCRIEPAPLAQAEQWLRRYDAFWTTGLDALDQALKAEDAVLKSASKVSRKTARKKELPK